MPGVRLGRPTVALERCTFPFDEVIEAVRIEDRIQSLIEGMPACPRQVIRRQPHSRSVFSILAATHGHAAV